MECAAWRLVCLTCGGVEIMSGEGGPPRVVHVAPADPVFQRMLAHMGTDGREHAFGTQVLASGQGWQWWND